MPKTIVVTGAGRGIGRSIVLRFAAEGWNVAFSSKTQASVSALEKELKASFPNNTVLGIVCDMSKKTEVFSFAQKIIETFSSIDILVNNAGAFIPGKITDESDADGLEDLMPLNLYSAYWTGKKIIPVMQKNKSGSIFNICSIAGLQAYPNGGSYAITKFAMQGYSKTIRDELKNDNIKVCCMYPGATYSDSWKSTAESFSLPESRFMKTEDIADMVWGIAHLSNSAVVEEIVLRPQLGDIVL